MEIEPSPERDPGRQRTGADIRDLKELLAAKRPSRGKDVILWRWAQSELFTVKTAYLFLQNGGVNVFFFDRLWSLKAPLKVKIFIWLVLKGRILTKDTLIK